MPKFSIRFLPVALAVVGMAGLAHAGDAKLIPAKIDRNAGQVNLIYPRDAQARGEEGGVDLLLQISSQGHPTGRVKVAKSSGFADLDNAAIQSAMNWRYTPAMTVDGDAQTSWVPLHIEYKLPQNAPQPAPQDSKS